MQVRKFIHPSKVDVYRKFARMSIQQLTKRAHVDLIMDSYTPHQNTHMQVRREHYTPDEINLLADALGIKPETLTN